MILATVLIAAAALAPELRPATADAILAEVRKPGASATVVNVWATWCQPCREEMPELLSLRRDLAPRGLRLVLVSGDFEEDAPEARRFLGRLGVDFPTFLKAGPDQPFIDGLDRRWTGALPATFVFDGAGQLRAFWEGRADEAALRARVARVLEQEERKDE